ncbi:uncharacterized protein LOC119272168 [Triticum dicoccoides]|uniref:uncharacterized protein LOC119272168 n=1 Tax=Triticum dicoccoides TaxID=85692 RepID=UPI00188E4129|nr:uncharacterized protein LOC119272168 [Triticum dicoccoides]
MTKGYYAVYVGRVSGVYNHCQPLRPRRSAASGSLASSVLCPVAPPWLRRPRPDDGPLLPLDASAETTLPEAATSSLTGALARERTGAGRTWFQRCCRSHSRCCSTSASTSPRPSPPFLLRLVRGGGLTSGRQVTWPTGQARPGTATLRSSRRFISAVQVLRGRAGNTGAVWVFLAGKGTWAWKSMRPLDEEQQHAVGSMEREQPCRVLLASLIPSVKTRQSGDLDPPWLCTTANSGWPTSDAPQVFVVML